MKIILESFNTHYSKLGKYETTLWNLDVSQGVVTEQILKWAATRHGKHVGTDVAI